MGKTNWDVAHAFAYGTTRAYTQSGNLYIDGDKIYSYGRHFCIARRVNDNTILMTTRGYSNTTAKHISNVHSACSHLDIVYCYDPAESHRFNLDRYTKELNEWVARLARARKPENYLREIRVVIERAKKYCNLFDLEMHDELKEFVDMMESDDRMKLYEQKVAELKEIERADKARRKERIKEMMLKWHNFESDNRPCDLDYEELRVNVNNKNRIETTMGVVITFEMGREFYERLKEGDIKVGDKLLYYQVRRVDDKETHIGCHKFKTKYLLDFGARVF